MAHSPAPSLAAIRGAVWLVDDSALEAEIVRQGLAAFHDVRVFAHAAPMLERIAHGERPDILLLDWQMPDINGIEACRFVRETTDAGTLPIILLTVRRSVEDLAHGLAMGANDYLRKPFDPPELRARVDAQLRMRQLNLQLVSTQDELRREAGIREQFLAILAHDLRQPLNVFVIAGSLLGEGDIPDETRTMLSARLGGAANRMRRMIEELLDFSRARPAGGVPLAPAPVDIARVVDEVVGEIRLAHPHRMVDVSVSGRCDGIWDADRLAQVVSNLVENALAHSHAESPIQLTLASDGSRVELAVENAGPTIPADQIPTLFDAFRRGASPTTKTQGLGLGLYIIAQIVKAHGGTVVATSADGRTRFAVTLPHEPSAS